MSRRWASRVRTYGAPYQRAFAELAETHRGRPTAQFPPLLRRAADHALLEFTHTNLREQAEAISTGEPFVLRRPSCRRASDRR